MKTYNGKNISKKNIQYVLRTMDATRIFSLVHIIYGGKVERKQVYDFIREFAPTNKVYEAAYNIAYTGNRHQTEPIAMVRASIRFQHENQKHIAIECLRENIARGLDNYTKRPIMGHTHLYFASPVYQHRDYNKWQSMEIKGNERFCEVICKLADKYFPINN